MHEPRQARQFGYEVSPRPAIATEGGRQFAAALRAQPALLHRAAKREGLWSSSIAVTAYLIILVTLTPPPHVAIPLGVVPLGALAAAAGGRRRVARSTAWTEPAAKVLDEHPWQVWPCRVEQAASEGEIQPRFVFTSSKRADSRAFDETVVAHVLLLAPDGSVARTYVSRVRNDVWRGVTDGLGALWICGDLRFDVVIATPAAQDCWIGTPIPQPSRQPAREDPDYIGSIAREAGGWALGHWQG
ncbi:hypothetical protein OG216_03510 [Streptomycetaceae bacterium NBC_01309]